MARYVSGMRVVQSGSLGGNDIVLLEKDQQRGEYYMGPGPDGRYAVVRAGDGCFDMAYKLAVREGRFTEELPSEPTVPGMGKLQV